MTGPSRGGQIKMSRIPTRLIASLLALTMLLTTAPLARAASPTVPAPPVPPAAAPEPGEADESLNTAPTPPRLSHVNGEVSFWRPGGEDWTPAQVNTPLAPGDQLYTGNRGNLEVQIDSRSFVRAWGDSQLGVENHEPDFLQIKVAAGHVSLDLRSLDGARTVELDTPAAAFTIDRPGYYRVDVTPERTSFITRRGGTAAMTPVGGQAVTIAASEQVVLNGGSGVRTFVAPELDVWDRWNYARTEALVDTVSARYVPQTVSGVDDLDQHGTWRVVPEYGSVWVPEGVAADWAPYTTGRWIWDVRFGWSWVDTAPWGWAPYHYGRWVHVGVWAWAPGPLVVRPLYAPALVAFLGAPGVRVAVGAPLVSWVALGWGEPCVPWWGRPGFVGRPWWGGWGGPRVVNNVVVQRTTVVNVASINVYRNAGVRNAVVAVRPDRFGRGPVADARLRDVDARRLEPVRGALDLRPDRASFTPGSGRGIHPPENVLERRVVATRAPVTRALPREPEGRGPARRGQRTPALRAEPHRAAAAAPRAAVRCGPPSGGRAVGGAAPGGPAHPGAAPGSRAAAGPRGAGRARRAGGAGGAARTRAGGDPTAAVRARDPAGAWPGLRRGPPPAEARARPRAARDGAPRRSGPAAAGRGSPAAAARPSRRARQPSLPRARAGRARGAPRPRGPARGPRAPRTARTITREMAGACRRTGPRRARLRRLDRFAAVPAAHRPRGGPLRRPAGGRSGAIRQRPRRSRIVQALGSVR
jgi:hypothetical protein